MAPAALVRDLVARAADPAAYQRWTDLVAQTGYCAHPVRLVGTVNELTLDTHTGEIHDIRQTYATDHEPDQVLLKACNNRRASRCPSCSETYRRDAYQLTRAGVAGGKGVPETVAGHPRLFVTFTAPSMGPVHTRRERGGMPRPCRPRHDATARCPHGRLLACFRRHQPDDPILGQPLCAECFDYQGAVLWNALAPELWRRTTEYLRRALARLAGMTLAELTRTVRVSYTKVAEYQARGLVHFHAVIRLDATASGDEPEAMLPPPSQFTAELLAEAIRQAAGAVTAPGPVLDGGTELRARWGTQLDLRPITTQPGQTSAELVAGYIAKYATKGTEGFGAALDHRLSEDDLDHLDVNPHIAKLVHTCWQLAHRPALAAYRLWQWAHMLGFGGHWATKSRRYATTMTALRQARARHGARHRGQVVYLDHDDPDSYEVKVALGQWRYVGSGYRTAADVLLAESAAAWAREQRRIAREELQTIVA